MAYNWDFFQIPAVGVDSTTLGTAVHSRDLNMRLSNFGALNVGNRLSTDYTRTDLLFKNKDELMNPVITYGVSDDPTRNENPFVWGSTVKRTRDDEMFKMSMDSRRPNGPALPTFDVMDTDVAAAGSMDATKKYPTEGWHSFGGKYDGYAAYNGVLR